jgi:hypothetical protein
MGAGVAGLGVGISPVAVAGSSFMPSYRESPAHTHAHASAPSPGISMGNGMGMGMGNGMGMGMGGGNGMGGGMGMGDAGDSVQQQQQMQGALRSLEDEFASLSAEYRRLLSSVQSSSATGTGGAVGDGSGHDFVRVPPTATPESVQAQAEEIVSVIQKLHKKGEQLRALKGSSWTPQPPIPQVP